jgi:SnoaL-like domain
MSGTSPVQIVEEFWDAVWNGHNPDAIDRFVVDDFILISAGKEVRSKENFRQWIRDFLGNVNDLKFESVESFQNEDGSRVASRWRIVGRNNGILGGESDQREITFTGIAVWAVREDGKLLCNWVERSSVEPVGR